MPKVRNILNFTKLQKLAIILSLLFLFSISATQASACTVFNLNNDGQYNGWEVDCENPFYLEEAGRVLATPVYLNEQELFDGATINVVSNNELSFVTDENLLNLHWRYFQLFRHQDENYYELAPNISGQYNFSPGVYTLLVNYRVVVNHNNYFHWLKNILLPTAHADWESLVVYGVTFTVTDGAENIGDGISNILFIPGVQGSYLYEGLLWESQRWVPFGENDLRGLMMSDSGQSLYNIYTKQDDVIRSIHYLYDVYDTFLDKLEYYKSIENSINDYGIYAYDWRYDVLDIARNGTKYKNETKYLVDEVERLAASSKTGKVTLITHSNGGLLAKALFAEYGNDVSDKIDNFIMVGTPQYGSLDAIAKLLHGYEDSVYMKIASKRYIGREVVRNFPAAYGLLPTEKYFQVTGGYSVVQNDGSVASRNLVGSTKVNSYISLNNFLGNSSRPHPRDTNNLNRLTNLNQGLLFKARNTQSVLENLSIHDDVRVFEIAGTGVDTMAGLFYQKLPCNLLIIGAGCEIFNDELDAVKVIPLRTTRGDGTVILDSATGYLDNKNTFIVNIGVDNLKHSNMLSGDMVLSAIDLILKDTQEVFVPQALSTRKKYLLGIHSPVDILITDSQGRETGISNDEVFENIPNTTYLELGESKYIIASEDITYDISIKGTDDGYYAFTVHELDGEDQELVKILGYTPVSSTTVATLTYSPNSSFSDISTDHDGDGVIDDIYTWNDLSIINDIAQETAHGGGGYRASRNDDRDGIVDGETKLLELYNQLYHLLLKLKEILENKKF